jgi:hypothetical protein
MMETEGSQVACETVLLLLTLRKISFYDLNFQNIVVTISTTFLSIPKIYTSLSEWIYTRVIRMIITINGNHFPKKN